LLKRAYLQNKIHALTMAYYGSITTMMTMTTPWPMSKLKFVKSGARKMDKAIKMSPDNVDVRMLRGTNSLNLPKFLKRGRYAILDFQHVLLLTPSADSEEKAELHRKISAGYLLLDDAKNAEKHRKLAQILEEK
jgi:hypothetical protein